MVPLVQYIPSAFLNTVVGSIYIESLYSIPGMGGLLVTCVQRHDNTMVQGALLLCLHSQPVLCCLSFIRIIRNITIIFMRAA